MKDMKKRSETDFQVTIRMVTSFVSRAGGKE